MTSAICYCRAIRDGNGRTTGSCSAATAVTSRRSLSLQRMVNVFIIGIGGFLGAVARYGVGIWMGQRWGRTFPLGTFAINVSGSLLIGFLMPLLTERFLVNPQWRLFLAVGFLGAYTTFSTFEYETGALLRDGEWLLAMLNIVLSVVAGFLALKVGEIVARSI